MAHRSNLLSLVLIAACAFGGTSPGRAAPLWQTLPPTPDLPPRGITQISTVNGVRLWYERWGQASESPVLLLHGGLANANYFGLLIPALLARHYQVIAVDSRGHGRSARDAKPYSYELMAQDVLALMDHLGLRRVTIVGWSDGGIVGLVLAIDHANRVERLYAFGSNADTSGAIEGCEKDPVFAAYIARTEQEYARLSPTPDQWEEFSDAIGKMWATQPDLTREQLHSIQVPVAIADGEHDECIKAEHTRYMASTIPGAQLVVLTGLSHFAFLQDPKAANASVLSFLR
jgi:pimeloyl-ACP methyl ester carboxylesterase